MNIDEIIKNRYSVRKFSNKEIEPEKIKPFFMMPIGYIADDCEPNKDLHFSRKM